MWVTSDLFEWLVTHNWRGSARGQTGRMEAGLISASEVAGTVSQRARLPSSPSSPESGGNGRNLLVRWTAELSVEYLPYRLVGVGRFPRLHDPRDPRSVRGSDRRVATSMLGLGQLHALLDALSTDLAPKIAS